jgi:2-polyprenyl-3-methyl-5-hydroxy-6-metoxy-1,4-benzoquinol methylase
VAYADITVNDRNPVKRWLQRRRFSDALRVLEGAALESGPWLLDFGAGDGELSLLLTDAIPAANVCVYEPTPSLLAEARAKLTGRERVCFADRLEALPPERFDFVFCLEVFEHLPERETGDAISAIARL